MISALVFDLDGVLWDSNALHDRAFRGVCQEHGLRPVDYERLAGLTTPSAWRYIVAENGLDLRDDQIDALTRAKRTAFLALADHASVRERDLVSLSERFPGIPWAIVTGASSATLTAFLSRTALRENFLVRISADDGLPSKPAPDPYLEAFLRLGITPADCLVFEDSESGLRAAESAGAGVVHVTNSADSCALHLRQAGDAIRACVQSPGAFLG